MYRETEEGDGRNFLVLGFFASMSRIAKLIVWQLALFTVFILGWISEVLQLPDVVGGTLIIVAFIGSFVNLVVYFWSVTLPKELFFKLYPDEEYRTARKTQIHLRELDMWGFALTTSSGSVDVLEADLHNFKTLGYLDPIKIDKAILQTESEIAQVEKDKRERDNQISEAVARELLMMRLQRIQRKKEKIIDSQVYRGYQFRCKVCDHYWVTRKKKGMPPSCPKCKSGLIEPDWEDILNR